MTVHNLCSIGRRPAPPPFDTGYDTPCPGQATAIVYAAGHQPVALCRTHLATLDRHYQHPPEP